MLDGLAWPSQGSGGSEEPRDAWPRGQTPPLASMPEAKKISFVKSLEYLSRRREELVDVFQRSISDDVVALSITSSCASRIIDCPEKVQEKDN